MSTVEKLEEAAVELLELVAEIRAGNVTDALATAKRIHGIGLDLIPVDMLKDSLLDRDRVWADLIVDIAEATKINSAADEAEQAKVGP